MRWLFKREGQRKRYASAIELLEKSNIASLRKRTKILVVDDEDEEIYEEIGRASCRERVFGLV